MYHRYSTALSHLFLSGIGIYCLNACRNSANRLAYISYAIIVMNSVMGIWKWGNPVHGWKIERIYHFTRLLRTLFVLPFIVTQLWLNQYPEQIFPYLHPMISTVPLILYSKRIKHRLIDVIIALNMLSCCWISLDVSNWFGIALVFSYAINHYVMRDNNEIFEIPTIDLYNYALCFFSLFAVRALQGTT